MADPAPGTRHDSIDVLRAGAILLMVQIHFTQNLSPDLFAETFLTHLSRALGMIPAPLFTFVAGMSLCLSLSRQPGGLAAGGSASLRHVRRGVLLFFFGLVFATFVRMPDQVFGWDILPFIGTSLLVLVALRRVPARGLALIALVVVVAAPLLRSLSGYAAHWPTGQKYISAFTLRDVAWGFIANGYFPLFPWLAFPLSGFLVARVFLVGEPGAQTPRGVLPAVGAALLALSFAGVWANPHLDDLWAGYASPVRFYPATTTFVLKVLGLILCAFWALHAWLDGRADSPLPAPLLGFLRRYSRFSLTTYVAHHTVHLWPLLLVAYLEGRPDPWHYYAAVVPTSTALLLAGGFIVAFYPVLIVWERRGRRFSFEWLLGKLAG